MLKDMSATVCLSVADFSDERAQAIQALNEANVPIVAWFLLPLDQSLWDTEDNAEKVLARVAEFVAWTSKKSLKFEAVGLDMELDEQDVQHILGADLVPVLVNVVRRSIERFLVVRKVYMDVVAAISTNFNVQSYVIPTILAERAANSSFLQRTLGNVDIGKVGLEVPMLYSTVYPDGLGVLNSFASSMKLAAIAVGTTGDGTSDPKPNSSGKPKHYASWDDFRIDLLVASNYTSSLFISSLEGCVRNGYLRKIQSLAWGSSLQPFTQQRIANETKTVNLVSHELKSFLCNAVVVVVSIIYTYMHMYYFRLWFAIILCFDIVNQSQVRTVLHLALHVIGEPGLTPPPPGVHEERKEYENLMEDPRMQSLAGAVQFALESGEAPIVSLVNALRRIMPFTSEFVDHSKPYESPIKK